MHLEIIAIFASEASDTVTREAPKIFVGVFTSGIGLSRVNENLIPSIASRNCFPSIPGPGEGPRVMNMAFPVWELDPCTLSMCVYPHTN